MTEDTATVLVVDDTPQNIDILSNVLRSDYKVKAALNGQKALEIASKEPHPDIILLDILMSGLDGFEVCRRLKQDPETESIPVIFITAMTDAEDETLGLDLGAVDYINKPINPAVVLSRVRAHLEIAAQRREIEEKEALLRMALDNMPGGMLLTDKDLNIRLMNTEFTGMVGVSHEEIKVGDSHEKLLRHLAGQGAYGTDIDIEKVVEERLESLRNPSSEVFLDHLPSGQVNAVHRRMTPGGDVVTIITDVTEQTRTQETANRLREAMDIFRDSMILYDENERVVFSNDRYHEFYPNAPKKSEIAGKTQEELLRSTLQHGLIDDPLALKDPDRWLSQKLAERRENPTFETEAVRTDGLTLLIRHQPTANGGLIISHTDITERKAAEREISKKEAELRMALENMPGGMIVVDKDLNVTLFNERYKDFYGDPEGVVDVGKSMRDVLASEVARDVLMGDGSPEEILQERLKSYAISKPVIFEDKTQDGRHIQLTRRPAPDGHTVSVAVDITERKNAEDLLAKSVGLINESIQYASYIQRSVLPTEAEMEDVFADYFSVWEPKDVVGGDIYLIRKYEAGVMLFVADCTGHGVPGAFMTMVATGALDQAIIENPKADPGLLLQRTNQLVKSTLGQYEDSDGQSDDGLECGLCLIDQNTGDLTYAGARFELWRVARGELEVVKGERHGIGYRKTPYEETFSNHKVPYDPEAMTYLFSDGIIDQIGGAKRFGYGKRRLKTNLLDYYPMTLKKQSAHLMRDFKEYQHNETRRDDVTLIGFVPRVI